MEWRFLFKPHILARGLDYYERGMVESLTLNGETAVAKVTGTQKYTIKLSNKSNQLQSIECDCPHAEEGHYCKHMAAVLYAYEEILEKRPQKRSIKGSAKDLEELVNTADDKVIRNFVMDILSQDRNLRSQFEAMIGQPASKNDMDYYRNQIHEIFNRYSDVHDFIHYEDTWEFQAELESFMEDVIQDILLNNQQYREAFELTNEIFTETAFQPMDDSNGVVTELAHHCVFIWEEILSDCTIDLKREMFLWFEQQLDGSIVDYMGEHIEEMLFTHFQEEEFLEEKIDYSFQKFKHYDGQNESSWSRRYEAQKWAIYYLQALQEQGDIEDKLIPFCEKYLIYPRVTEFYIDWMLENNHTHQAIDVLEEKLKQKQTVSSEYLEKLMRMYEEVGNTDSYLGLLSKLILLHGSLRMDLFQEYKKNFSKKEWPVKRDCLFEELSKDSDFDVFLVEEGMEDELVQFVLNSRGLYKLQKYQDMALEMKPDKVFDKYEQTIFEEARSTANRKKYRQIVGIIREMKRLPESEERVNQVVSALRETYGNRPAMMDELDKL